jgi:endonuclease III
MQLPLPFDADSRLPRIRDCLRAVHGPQRDDVRLDPVSQFVKAIISSDTRDEISSRIFAQLQQAMPWEALTDIDSGVLSAMIAEVRHASNKARDLIMAMRIIRARQGRLNLAFLADWPIEDAMSWLCRLRGIGDKVAAATLNFSELRQRVLAVDRHVLRTSQRIGLVPPNADYTRGSRVLMRMIPNEWDADDLYELHWLMKAHGQTKCRFARPLCDTCPLAQICASAATRDKAYGQA